MRYGGAKNAKLTRRSLSQNFKERLFHCSVLNVLLKMITLDHSGGEDRVLVLTCQRLAGEYVQVEDKQYTTTCVGNILHADESCRPYAGTTGHSLP